MAENMRLYLELMGKSSNLRGELNSAKGAVSRWSAGVRSELSSLRNIAGSVTGQLAALGISFSALQTMSASARLDKSLVRIKQTAGATAGEMANLRRELFTMARQTGKPVEDLQAGFDNLVQSGLDWKSAMETIKAVNIGSAVTGAQATTLSGGLTVGATAFNLDLAKPGLALELLDKMTVAGRQGNAELENLSDIFARVGVNAASAGMSFDQTLAFIEGLSLVERQPERLATLADSTLRLFNNLKYMKAAQKATGVRFFDAKGERRDALAIIADIKKRYDTLKTDQQRAVFIQKAFGHADLDTQKGMKTFLQGDILTKVRGQFTRDIGHAGDTLVDDLGDATKNLIDQIGMLKADLRQAADGFVQPINATLTDLIKWARDSKANGGLGLNGKEMFEYGAGGGLGLLLLGRYGGKAASRLFSGSAGLAAGTIQGKALEQFGGVTPVFVVNMPGGGLPGGSVPTTATGSVGKAAGALSKAVNVVGAGAGGYGAGTIINQGMGELSGHLTDGKYGGEGWLGNMVYDWMHPEEKQEIKNDIKVEISVDQAGRAIAAANDPNTKLSATTNLKRGNFADPNYF
ncbi:MAG: phage tail tape measure protein [Desulfobulbus sp.]|jgi:TP901 family phage tail tape measure protein|uniref:phage tail tape measure protein n=1 Tax=Desulfobulbus sp. TaxID=895 RepID=UPI0028494D72|nr:phage tail tape measure protein [Desulfobulbus sp.]MDR2551457.1 phage tail tape measure protein [Desulfobulbus sp.]